MKKDKIAVLIVGHPNAGKTTTIKYFEKFHDEDAKLKSQCRIGWRRDIQLFLGKLDALHSWIFFMPSSPTESGKPLEKTLINFKPEMLLVAEQFKGSEYISTIEFLTHNNYFVVEFKINQEDSPDHWKLWTENTKEIVLRKRSEDIGNAFREFILQKIS